MPLGAKRHGNSRRRTDTRLEAALAQHKGVDATADIDVLEDVGGEYFSTGENHRRRFDLASAVDSGDDPLVRTMLNVANKSPTTTRASIGVEDADVEFSGVRRVGEDQYVVEMDRMRQRGGLFGALREPVRETVPLTRNRSDDPDDEVDVFTRDELNRYFAIPLAAQMRNAGRDPRTRSLGLELASLARGSQGVPIDPGFEEAAEAGERLAGELAASGESPAAVHGFLREGSADPQAFLELDGKPAPHPSLEAPTSYRSRRGSPGDQNSGLAGAVAPLPEPEPSPSGIGISAFGRDFEIGGGETETAVGGRRARRARRKGQADERATERAAAETEREAVNAEVDRLMEEPKYASLQPRRAQRQRQTLRNKVAKDRAEAAAAGPVLSQEAEAPARQRTKQHEGLSLEPYQDGDGYSVGFGHHLPGATKEQADKFAEGLTEEKAEELFETDWTAAEQRTPGWMGRETWTGLNDARRSVLVEMNFQMGENRAEGFDKMEKAVKAGDFDDASEEMLDSKWAKEQAPQRAAALAGIMRTGEWNPPAGADAETLAQAERATAPREAAIAADGTETEVEIPATQEQAVELVRAGTAPAPGGPAVQRVLGIVENVIKDDVRRISEVPPEGLDEVVWAIASSHEGTVGEKMQVARNLYEMAGHPLTREPTLTIDDALGHLGRAGSLDQQKADLGFRREKATVDAQFELANLQLKTRAMTEELGDGDPVARSVKKIDSLAEDFLKGKLSDDDGDAVAVYDALFNREIAKLRSNGSLSFDKPGARFIWDRVLLKAFKSHGGGIGTTLRGLFGPELPDSPAFSVLDSLVVNHDGTEFAIKVPGRGGTVYDRRLSVREVAETAGSETDARNLVAKLIQENRRY